MVQKCGESELPESDQTGCNSGVEDILRVGPTGFAEESEIVIAAVDDDDFPFEGFEEWREVEGGEGVDEEVCVRRGDLDEAKLFEVAVQGIRFGIEGDFRVFRDVFTQREECGLFGDHLGMKGRGIGDLAGSALGAFFGRRFWGKFG